MINPLKYHEYIPHDKESDIKNFKYKGGSDSLSYYYIWSSFSQFLVEKFVPIWVAPNLLTFINILFLASSHILLVIYSPDFKSEIPTWVSFYSLFAAMAYYHLDNMDGK